MTTAPLGPIVDWVVEFLIGQIIRHGPRVAKSFLRQVGLPSRPRRFALRSGLVNRERELRAIRAALSEAPYSRILYLSGPGGAGKTRLLEEAAGLLNGTRADLPLRWGGIVDLYHTDLHSVFALQTTIIQALDPSKQYFHNYRSALERFERQRAEGLVGPALDVELDVLNIAFQNDYAIFANDYRPVLAFDTLESLDHESDLIQSLCRLKDTSVAIRDWLLEWVERLDNTVILLAGRPQPALRKDLERTCVKEPGQLEVIEVGGLTRDESRRLLEFFLKSASPSVQILRDHSDRLWQLVNGLPVLLAMTVELVAQGEQIDLAGEEAGSGPAWGQRLVNTLFRHNDSEERILFLMALARKGLTAKLLHYLEPGLALEDCERHLAELRNSCVVKVRPDHNEIFLHDALYELFDAHTPQDADLSLWCEQLADYYRVDQVEADSDRDVWGRATVNLLYYELQRDPRRAFETGYIRWGEIALKGYEIELDMQLRDELLRFLHHPANGQRAGDKGLTQAVVDRDSAVRWIKRYLARARYEQSKTIAETILALGPEPYRAIADSMPTSPGNLSIEYYAEAQTLFNSDDPFFWGHLLTYYGEALVYSGAPEVRTRRVLDEAVRLLDSVSLARDEALAWLRERVLGRAYDRLGYLLRTYGHFGGALEAYRRALPHFEAYDDIRDEQAATQNNLAFVLALLGDVDGAKDQAKKALTLRSRLGQRFPIALSRNTLGLIHALEGQYEWGWRECQLALSIFEELELPRGIGLACNALGFVLRHQGEAWNVKLYDPDRISALFQQAEEFLNQAVNIFSEQVQEPIRLWEAYNELGSLDRAWGNLLQQEDHAAALKRYEEAVSFQLKALEVAQLHDLHFQEADTCDDLAQVFADQRDFDKAHRWLQRSLSLVPEGYTLAAGKGFEGAPEPGEAYWLILGKTHQRLGIWALPSNGLANPSHDEWAKKVEAGFQHFALAAAYFERYWPNTIMLSRRLRLMARYLHKSGSDLLEAKQVVNQVATDYAISLATFLDTLEVELNRPV